MFLQILPSRILLYLPSFVHPSVRHLYKTLNYLGRLKQSFRLFVKYLPEYIGDQLLTFLVQILHFFLLYDPFFLHFSFGKVSRELAARIT